MHMLRPDGNLQRRPLLAEAKRLLNEQLRYQRRTVLTAKFEAVKFRTELRNDP